MANIDQLAANSPQGFVGDSELATDLAIIDIGDGDIDVNHTIGNIEISADRDGVTARDAVNEYNRLGADDYATNYGETPGIGVSVGSSDKLMAFAYATGKQETVVGEVTKLAQEGNKLAKIADRNSAA